MRRLFLVFLLALLYVVSFGQMRQVIKTYGTAGKYIEYTPINMQPEGVILALHGLGEIGTDISILERTELPKLFKYGVEVPYIVICPQISPPGSSWSAAIFRSMFKIIDEYKLPKHLTGLSLGGMGCITGVAEAYKWNLNKTGYFKTVGIVCGKTTTTNFIPFMDVRLKWWHGTADPTMPYRQAVNFTTGLCKAGGSAELQSYPNLGHNIWGKAYNLIDVNSYWYFLKKE